MDDAAAFAAAVLGKLPRGANRKIFPVYSCENKPNGKTLIFDQFKIAVRHHSCMSGMDPYDWFADVSLESAPGH